MDHLNKDEVKFLIRIMRKTASVGLDMLRREKFESNEAKLFLKISNRVGQMFLKMLDLLERGDGSRI